jgi:cysteine desulfurase family protein (TIGR01976 family)
MPIMGEFPIGLIRREFPALKAQGTRGPAMFFDNPAGTQVPRQVLERTQDVLQNRNANLGGFFATSLSAGELVARAREAMADFYNASGPDEIVFGQNMTTLTLHMSRCIGRRLRPGDEIILTRMDHDANIAPWLLLAEDRGLKIRWLDFNTDSYEFDDNALDGLLGERTRLLAIGHASNCIGTINEVKNLAAKAKTAGALVYVDAVQLAPHQAMDVKTLGADIVVSSAYKWYGPHQGVLWGRREVLEERFAYKVRPAGNAAPDKFETGTLSHEGIAGCLGAVEYLTSLGQRFAAAPKARQSADGNTRQALEAAFGLMAAWEQQLCRRLIEGLMAQKGVVVRGITSSNAMHRRVPTVSFTLEGRNPAMLAKQFAARDIFVWSGHNYAIEPIGRLGLADKGGVLRVGLAHYNTPDEVDVFLTALDEIASNGED